MVGPVLVTVEAPRTAKFAADPRFTGNWSAAVTFAAVKQRATAAPRRNALTLFVRFTDLHFTSLCFFMIKLLLQFALREHLVSFQNPIRE
jgi:hypothetical protein